MGVAVVPNPSVGSGQAWFGIYPEAGASPRSGPRTKSGVTGGCLGDRHREPRSGVAIQAAVAVCRTCGPGLLLPAFAGLAM